MAKITSSDDGDPAVQPGPGMRAALAAITGVEPPPGAFTGKPWPTQRAVESAANALRIEYAKGYKDALAWARAYRDARRRADLFIGWFYGVVTGVCVTAGIFVLSR